GVPWKAERRNREGTGGAAFGRAETAGDETENLSPARSRRHRRALPGRSVPVLGRDVPLDRRARPTRVELATGPRPPRTPGEVGGRASPVHGARAGLRLDGGGRTMRALVFHGPGERSWDSVPDREITAETDAIVRIDSATICGTDLHILKGDVPEVEPGTILGHEAVGTIVETGTA